MVLLVCAVPGTGQAQLGRVGSEFQVNTYTGNAQTYPAKCRDAAGNFVVAWQSNLQDGSSRGVFGQRFSSAGAAQGSEFQINTYTTNTQQNPALCCDAAGTFVVAWQSDTQDGSKDGVFGQRFAFGLPAAPAPALGLVGLSVAGAGLLLGGLAVAARRRRRR
jgi:hypothetical protein